MSLASNTTRGKGTPGSREHGRDMSPKQVADQEKLKTKSKNSRVKFFAYEDPEAEELARFPSNFAALRKGADDTWAYRVPPLVPGISVPAQTGKKKKKGKGRKPQIKEAYREVRAGEPDIDVGVRGWVVPPKTEDFVTRGNRMDALLETFDRVTKSKDKEDPRKVTDYVRSFHAESIFLKKSAEGDVEEEKGKTCTLTLRDTIGVSPALSRALQLMVEAGLVEEAREAIESIMGPLGREYEATYVGEATCVKVTSMVAHVTSGHFHFDCWGNDTYPKEAETGVDGKKITARFWDCKARCHHGPGPGMAFWMRHLEALGDLKLLAKTDPQAAKGFAPTRLLIKRNMAESKKRAAKQGRPDDFARDIKMNAAIDCLLGDALPANFVEMGRKAYREHLIEAYKNGFAGVRMSKPKDVEMVRKLAARSAAAADKLDEIELRETQLEEREKELGAKVGGLATRESKLALGEKALQEMTEPVSVAAVAAELRFVPDETSVKGGLIRNSDIEGKDTNVRKLILSGQSFILSLIGSKNKPMKGQGSIELLLAIKAGGTLENAIKQLVAWFPPKRHAIMAEVIEKHGSHLLREMMPGPDQGRQPPPGGRA